MAIEMDSGRDVEYAFEKWFRGGNHIMQNLTTKWDLAVVLTLMYVVMVFCGRKFMESRKRFDLRSPLIWWSTFLAIFSIMGTIRVWKFAFELYSEGGIRALLCDTAYFDAPIAQFWSLLFLYSKFLEYGDTAFIILRKQRLIFLHWYHHLTVALFCWMTWRGKYAGGLVFMALNYAVHALMYTYYAFKAAGFRIPRQFAKLITTSQILQMVVGCATVLAVAFYGKTGQCKSSREYVICGCVMYASYLALFMHFFYQTYLTKPKQTQKAANNAPHSATDNGNTVMSHSEDQRHNGTQETDLRARKLQHQNGTQ